MNVQAYDIQDGEHTWSVDVGKGFEEISNAALETRHDGFAVGLVDLRCVLLIMQYYERPFCSSSYQW